MAQALQGLDELLSTLSTIKDRGAKRAARAGLTAGLAVLRTSMRSQINATSASPALKRAARASIGSKLKKEAEGIAGKVGFSVGKKLKTVSKQSAAKLAKQTAKGTRSGGVGISASNIHWFVLGTVPRETGSVARKSKGGNYRSSTGNPVHKTGSIRPILGSVVLMAVASSNAAMLDAARKKVTEVLAAEAAKARKRR